MFSSLPGPGAFFFIAALGCAIGLTVLAVVLKIFGVLLLSWWLVCSPVPLLLLLAVFIAGIISLFSN